MEFNNSKPIYLQIIEDIKKKLIRKEIKPGDKIPSQRELAKNIKVNPNTVQRAYREMESMGLVKTLRGQGTFISDEEELLNEIKKEMASEVLIKFIQEMRSLGFKDDEVINLIKSWQEKI
ncbi:GntR family transcriptional regulator [Tepidibacter formicigenes]|jgi:GntR family transcriptional regulator|uniref:Transcriptional regulator, GntR family n=1 Tax=Tepidibacter formicigenes DSM 15518 TaxID=1123349 RepID=A0A1M6J7D4_9FIRM|nr:GntR family transcriptional regulator [Tepidibacter formicigenes]SHJ42537.1 transcriptional regulator, GntR family [Tepidibacter formicigenes DSM 15518]